MKTVQNTILAILLLALQSLAEETCLIGNDKASFTEFQEGDVVELGFSLCGESSCICDPTLEKQLACSFCYDAPTGDCYKHGDVVLKDGKTCTCESASVNLVCKPDPGTPTTESRMCGDIDLTKLSGVCGNDFSFPWLCDETTGTPTPYYPYCEHTTKFGDTVCAKDGTFISFINQQSERERCDCSFDMTTKIARSDCVEVTESPTKNPTPSPSSSGNPLSRQSWIVSFGLLTVAGLLVL